MCSSVGNAVLFAAPEVSWLACCPCSCKLATIIPVTKKLRPAELNDYRLGALTSVVMKCSSERCQNIFWILLLIDCIDQLQFAYQQNKSPDDAILLMSMTRSFQLKKSSKFLNVNRTLLLLDL